MRTKLLISENEICQRVSELGEKITSAYDDDKPLLCVCVLKGAFMFFGELVKRIDRDVIVDFITLSSYGGMSTTGNVKLLSDIRESAADKHVLIVEDIVDSGYTLEFLGGYFKDKGAISVKTACLIDRPLHRKVDVKPDFCAFTVTSSAFLVGCGLDFNQHYRGIADIMEVELE